MPAHGDSRGAKVDSFDTGFMCYYRGWQDFRDDDLGALWEHFVLNEIMARSQSRGVFYWRDKGGHEVIEGIRRKGKPVNLHCAKVICSEDHLCDVTRGPGVEIPVNLR